MADEFSDYYGEHLDGTYDCADRIVLNGYFRLGCSPGGLRVWWRRLKGSDEDLDNAHLMRMAGRMARRVRAHAKAHQIPLIDCKKEDRKHEIAERHLPKDADFVGVFLILVARAPAPVWDVQYSKKGKIANIAWKKPYPYVKHYSFHIIDPDWGHITIKLSGHPPFTAQIILNGHEYVACQAKKQGIGFAKEGNCFTDVSDATQLAQVAETLSSPEIIGRLRQVCERWIYSACSCFALDVAEQERTGFHYDYSIYQMEYSRNLWFQCGNVMDQIFQGVVERTRVRLDVKRLKTIFGFKKRPSQRKGQKPPRLEVVVERPEYDLTVFKLHFGPFTVRMYTKGERVLRLEAIVHNARRLRCGRSLPKFADILVRLQGILERFLNALHCIDISCIGDDTWETLHTASYVGQTRVGGIDIRKPRMQAVIGAVIALAVAPQGFRSSDIAAKVRAITGASENDYTARKAAYDLKKLRGKHIVRKIGRSRRYETVPEGLQAIVALLVLRERVIRPVLAGASEPKHRPRPKEQSLIDAHYETIQRQMHSLFELVGIAA